MTNYDPRRPPTGTTANSGWGWGWIIFTVVVVLIVIGFGWGGWRGGSYGNYRQPVASAHVTAPANTANAHTTTDAQANHP